MSEGGCLTLVGMQIWFPSRPIPTCHSHSHNITMSLQLPIPVPKYFYFPPNSFPFAMMA